jgi:hypothetical protein
MRTALRPPHLLLLHHLLANGVNKPSCGVQ